jgi:UTP--glucose-1-phosphate uridylyltransferase
LDGEPFVVLLPDVITVCDQPVVRQLIRAYEQHGGSFVAVREVEVHEFGRHGIVRIESSTDAPASHTVRINGLLEKPSPVDAPSRLGVFGRYLVEPGIWDAISQTQPDARGEVQLTDALDLFCQTNPLCGLRFEGLHYDAGDPLGYLKANIELSLRDPQVHNSLLSYLSCLKHNS